MNFQVFESEAIKTMVLVSFDDESLFIDIQMYKSPLHASVNTVICYTTQSCLLTIRGKIVNAKRGSKLPFIFLAPHNPLRLLLIITERKRPENKF